MLLSSSPQTLQVCLEPADARIQVANFNFRRAPELVGPQLSIVVPQNGSDPIRFTWTSRVGQTYQIQKRSSLTGGTWEPVGAPLAGTGAILTASGPPPANSAHVYFRLVVSPAL